MLNSIVIPTFAGMTIKVMVIAKNDMDFEPDWETIVSDSTADTCNIQWRVSQVSCWTDWYWDPSWQAIAKNKKPNAQYNGADPNHGWTIYEPCDTSCCARQLEVCRYGKNNVEITDLGSLSEGGDCDTVTLRTMDCYDVCDYLKDFEELYPKIPNLNKPEIKEVIKYDLENNSLFKTLSISYTNQYLKVSVDNINGNDIAINVYNLLSKPVITKSV